MPRSDRDDTDLFARLADGRFELLNGVGDVQGDRTGGIDQTHQVRAHLQDAPAVRAESLEHAILNCELNRFCLDDDGSLVSHHRVELCASASDYPSF